MLVALIARDKPDSLAIRQTTRPDHLAYLNETGAVSQAGPLLNAAEEMVGSLIILEVDDLADAENWAANDPYAKAGLFQSVELIPWKRVIG